MKQYKDKDYLKREYVENGKSASDIAAENDCSKSTVYNWVNKHGLNKGGELSQDEKNLIQNTIATERTKFLRKIGEMYGGDRDMYENLGYKEELGWKDYWNKYSRMGIAARIVDAPAQTTWRVEPEVTVKDDEWEQYNELAERLNLYHYFERADRLSGIGSYGVLLIGVKGGDSLSEPLERVAGPDDIIYLSAFHQDSAEIYEFEGDPTSERFGKPLSYMVDLTGQNLSSSKVEQKRVHWTRVIHIAEGKLEDEVYGEPRLRKVYNRLDDLMKIVGGSAEMYWQGAAPMFKILADEGASFDEGVGDIADNLIHKLRRYIQLAGADIQPIDTKITEPKEIFSHIISLISAKTRIPKRILIGSERGELASSQDEANWFGKIGERQQQFAEPEILRTFIDRLIEIGALDSVEYEIEWQALFELSELEEADLHAKNAKALKDASGGMPQDIATVEEIRDVLGLPEEMPESEAMNEIALDEDNEQVREQFNAIID